MGSEKLVEIWPQWRLVGEIGCGSYGTVYKAVREEHGVESYSAIKVISVPQQEAEVSSIRSDGLDDTAARKYFENIVTNKVGEIKVLESMKGNSNIVSIEDYRVLEYPDKICWDIFIRMELLTGFGDYIADKKPDEDMAIKLGMDICSALELCAKRNIVHRDVKPENIFVSQFGDFKIGDFGIARELELCGSSFTVSGTQNYMAPEVQSMNYDATVDFYSLGLVLYKLLNNNRLPFLDPYAQLINPQDYHAALERRFSGEEIPDPIGASPALAQIIRKACAYNPEKRFRTATDFKSALAAVRNTETAATSEPAGPAAGAFAQSGKQEPRLQAVEPEASKTHETPKIQLRPEKPEVVKPALPSQPISPEMLIGPARSSVKSANSEFSIGPGVKNAAHENDMSHVHATIGPGYTKKQATPAKPSGQKNNPTGREGGRKSVLLPVSLVVALVAVVLVLLIVLPT